MSAKKKSAGKGAKRAKPAKVAKARAKVAAPKKRGAAKKAAPRKAGAKKAAPKKLAAKKAAPKKLAAKKAAPKKLAAKKAAPKKLAAKVPAKKKTARAKPAAKPPITRRDGSGHLDPKYAADLRERIREQPKKDDDRAFLAGSRTGESLSEELGEEFVETVTSGEDEGNEVRDQRVTEELGGPFTVTSGGTEFADGDDASNPKSATREPFPRT
jgi:hypothetical protein